MKRLIKITTIILTFLILFPLISSMISGPNSTINISDNKLEIHLDPLVIIHNNTAFGLYATSGDGSELTPYIIENLVIDGNSNADDCIDIQNTNKHFIIRNCTIFDADEGIYLKNVSNGQFQWNAIENSNTGIYAEYTNHCVYLNNIINNSGVAIYISHVYYHTALNNILDHNDIGIETKYVYFITAINNTCNHVVSQGWYLWGVNNSIFKDNTAIRTGYEGFFIDDSCWNNTFQRNIAMNCTSGFYISDDCRYSWFEDNIAYFSDTYGWDIGQSSYPCFYNTFINNTASFGLERGFYVRESNHFVFINNSAEHNKYAGFHATSDCNNFTLINNKFNNNGEYGIHLESTNNTLKYNQINNNTLDGIYLEWSDGNSISLNWACNNGDYGIEADTSDNNNITWNILHNNANCIIDSGGTGNLIANNSCNAATLTSATLTPDQGDQYTLFNITVLWTDADDMAPFGVRVFIDGTPYVMTKLDPSDTNYTDGCWYIYSTTLARGTHIIYFEAYDILYKITTVESETPSIKGARPSSLLFIILFPAIGLAFAFYVLYKRRETIGD